MPDPLQYENIGGVVPPAPAAPAPSPPPAPVPPMALGAEPTGAWAWFQRHIEEPWASLMYGLGAQLTPWNIPGEESWRQRRERGAGWYEAARQTYQEEELPWWVTLPAEMSLPAYWLPVAGWGARGAGVAGRGLTRAGLPRLGAGVTRAGAVPWQAEQAIARTALAPLAGGRVPTAVARRVPALAERGVTPIAGRRIPGAAQVAGRYVVAPAIRKWTKPVMDRLLATFGREYGGLRGAAKETYAGLEQRYGRMLGDIGTEEIAGITAPTVASIAENILKPTLGRALAIHLSSYRKLGAVPRWAISATRRTVLVENPIEARIIAEKIQAMAVQRHGVLSLHKLAAVGDQHAIWGTNASRTSDNLLCRNLPKVAKNEGKSPYLGDVLENYKAYKLIDKQLEWVGIYHSIPEPIKAFLKSKGITRLDKYEGVLHAIRRGSYRIDMETGEFFQFGKRGTLKSGRLGGLTAMERPRWYKAQRDGVWSGEVYNPNQVENLAAELSAYAQILSEEAIINYIRPLGKTWSQRIDSIIQETFQIAGRQRDNARFALRRLEKADPDKVLNYQTRAALRRRDISWIPEEYTSATGASVISRSELDALRSKARLIEREAAEAHKEASRIYYAERDKIISALDITKRAKINHPAFNGRVFPKEIADAFRRGMGEQADGWMQAVAGVAAKPARVMRALVAALDFSAPFIQGLPVLGIAPDIWARNALRHYTWFFKPRNFDRWMSNPRRVAIARDFINHGGYLGTFEYAAAVPEIRRGAEAMGRAVAGEPGARIGRGAIQQTYGRGEVAFGSFGDACRIELWEAMKPLYKTPEELRVLADMLNKMTGYISPIEWGIPTTQQLAEQALIFAPRYTRAGFALIENVLRGGITGQMARQSLGQMMAGGAILYVHFCKALGQEPNFDPRTGRFMSIEVFGQHIGIGGFMTSAMRLAAHVGASITDPEKFRFWPEPGEDVGDYITRIRWDNPFFRFLYNKSSPLVGLGTEALTRRNYMGEDFETPLDWAKFVSDQTTPIAMQALAEMLGEPLARPMGYAPAFAMELAGGRTFPISLSERRNTLRNQYAQAEYGKNWQQLDRLQKRTLRTMHSEIEQAERAASERWALTGGGSAESWYEWGQDRDYIQEKYITSLNEAAAGFHAGRLSGREFRERADEAATVRRDNYNDLERRYSEIYDVLGDPQRINPEHRFDAALEAYQNMIWDNPDLTDEFGIYDFGKAEEQRQLWQRDWPDMWDRLQEYLRVGQMEEPPLMQELRQAREILRPYRQIQEALLRGRGLLEIYNRLQPLYNTNPELARQIYDRLGITEILDRVRDIRRRMRDTNPQIAYFYDRFY